MNANFSTLKWLVISSILILSSCRAYKQDILFRLDENFTAEDLATPIARAEQNYRLQPNDVIGLDVFTNKGERLIDPNFDLQQGINNQGLMYKSNFQYLVQADGTVKFPIVGKLAVDSLTIDEAEKVLEQAYNRYYKESFVKLKMLNRRVIVLGANGGQVVPLDNENMTIAEVLALYGGLDLGARAGNVRVIRGELNSPQVFQIDLSTLAGMQSTVVAVEPGDIIYVEPWRRPWLESLRDVSPLLSLASSVLTLIVVVQNLGR